MHVSSDVELRKIGGKELSLQASVVEPDYLITDSLGIDTRPTLLGVLTRPTLLIRMFLLVIGAGIAVSNIIGEYNNVYLYLEATVVAVGMLTALADYKASVPPYASPTDAVSPNIRSGAVDDAVVHLYAAIYTASTIWLALRSGPLCPSWLPSFDPVLGMAAAAIFILSLLAPVLTLLHHYDYVNGQSALQAMVRVARQGQGMKVEHLPDLTDTEVLRAQSLIGVGVVGCLFAPIAVKFALSGQDWWVRVSEIFPEQGMLESSTALFGVLATQVVVYDCYSVSVTATIFSPISSVFRHPW